MENSIRSLGFKPPAKNCSCETTDEGVLLTNPTTKKVLFKERFPEKRKGKCAIARFIGAQIDHGNASLVLLDEEDVRDGKPQSTGKTPLNSTGYFFGSPSERFRWAIEVAPNSKVLVTELSIEHTDDSNLRESLLEEHLHSNRMVLTPDYPSAENEYLCAFIHTRAKAYKQHGLDFDLVCSHPLNTVSVYEFEGVKVLRLPYYDLRLALQKRHYEKIAVHFFGEVYARIFDACDLHDTELFIWGHSVDFLYWDNPVIQSKYFAAVNELTEGEKRKYEKNDALIKRYNEKPNVTWVFVSNFIKERSEKLIGVKYGSWHVIPNSVDTSIFKYQEKDPELRKKIFFVRKFDNLATYAIDVNVRCILELSKRDFFDDLEFNIYGGGSSFKKLTAPLTQFENVHLHNHYLTHEELAEVHGENGVALFATRYDTQGVSMCESASSGLPVVSTRRRSVADFLPEECGLLADAEDYRQYADIIERLYKDPQHYVTCSRAHAEKAQRLCGFDNTVGRELELLSAPHDPVPVRKVSTSGEQPVLSVCVPVYNLSWHIPHVLASLLGQRNAGKLEVIVVNDGSKDDSAEIAKSLMEQYNDPAHPVVRLIDKENGGHGSTINAALEIARGKYFKIVDCDDRVNQQDFAELLDILDGSDDDIVLCNYSEDQMGKGTSMTRHLYDFMVPGFSYAFEDLCYKNYGFKKWGPILHTGYFDTEMLRKTDFKLTEHCFYVDMEFDMYSVVNAETISFYPLDVYQYAVGRDDQSVSKSSFMRNYKNHETVIFTMLEYVNAHPEISDLKRKYIEDKLIAPLFVTQYLILVEWMQDEEEFRKFDEKVKKYPNMYKKRPYVTDEIRFHRKTDGKLMSNAVATKMGIAAFKALKPMKSIMKPR